MFGCCSAKRGDSARLDVVADGFEVEEPVAFVSVGALPTAAGWWLSDGCVGSVVAPGVLDRLVVFVEIAIGEYAGCIVDVVAALVLEESADKTALFDIFVVGLVLGDWLLLDEDGVSPSTVLCWRDC